MSTANNPQAASVYCVENATFSTGNLLPFISPTDPGSTNVTGPSGPFKIGQRWINSLTSNQFYLGSLTATLGAITANWIQMTVASSSPSFTGSVTAGTGFTATTGNIVATNGNFVASTAGTGLLLNSPTATGAASGPVVVNGRSGSAIFTGVSIAAAADLTLTITNSAITASTTQVIYSLQGATTGSAIQIKSVTNSAGSSVVVVTNGTGASTTTANIALIFLVLN